MCPLRELTGIVPLVPLISVLPAGRVEPPLMGPGQPLVFERIIAPLPVVEIVTVWDLIPLRTAQEAVRSPAMGTRDRSLA